MKGLRESSALQRLFRPLRRTALTASSSLCCRFLLDMRAATTDSEDASPPAEVPACTPLAVEGSACVACRCPSGSALHPSLVVVSIS